MTLEEQIKQLEGEVSNLFDRFTRAAASRSGSILNQLLDKKQQIKALKEQLKQSI